LQLKLINHENNKLGNVEHTRKGHNSELFAIPDTKVTNESAEIAISAKILTKSQAGNNLKLQPAKICEIKKALIPIDLQPHFHQPVRHTQNKPLPPSLKTNAAIKQAARLARPNPAASIKDATN